MSDMTLPEKVNNLVRWRIKSVASGLNKKTNGTLTPDTITVFSVAAHIPIAIMIALDQLLLAGVLLIVFGLFDVLDGELARLQKSASPKGMVFDASSDRIKETLVFSAIAYNISQTSGGEWAFLAALALGGAVSVSYAKAKSEVALALRRTDTDHHRINRYFSEGIAAFEIRTALIILGLLSGQLLLATAVVALLASVAMFERLYVYLRKL